MPISGFGRRAFGLSLALAFLGGCGGQAVTTEAVSSGAADRAKPAVRLMKPGTSSGDLLYVAADGTSYVLTYPQGALVGTIHEGATDACSDSAGDVFLAADSRVDEFSHGSTTPSASLLLPGTAFGCAVDGSTGNLAVVFERTSGDDVAVFANAEGTPTLYNSNLSSFNPGYDNEGNLFVDGYGQGGALGLAELPSGGSAFNTVAISPSIKASAGRLQYDGTYLTLESGIGMPHKSLRINRLSISGSTATVVSTTTFAGINRDAFLSWIYGDAIIVPYGTRGSTSPNIGYWNYPMGGARSNLLKNAVGKQARINAVTVSVGSESK